MALKELDEEEFRKWNWLCCYSGTYDEILSRHEGYVLALACSPITPTRIWQGPPKSFLDISYTPYAVGNLMFNLFLVPKKYVEECNAAILKVLELYNEA